MCGKVPYESQGEADRAAKRIMKRATVKGMLYTYYCEACRAHHLSSQKVRYGSKGNKRK